MSDTTPQSVSNGCRKYVKSRIIINTFNTFNNVETVTIKGKSMLGYMADLLERNDANKIELDRCREANKTLRQMNNQMRLQLESDKFEYRRNEDVKKLYQAADKIVNKNK